MSGGDMSTAERWTIIGVGVTAVGVLIAFLAWWFPRGVSHGEGGTTSSVSSLTPTPTASYQLTDTITPTPTVSSTASSIQGVPTTTDEPPPDSPPAQALGINDVYVTASTGNGLLQKRGDVFEMQPSFPSSINPPYMTFRWSSQGANGEIRGECNVEAVITGPGNYPQERRSGDCSGRVSPDLKIMELGTYDITVSVSPIGGGASATGYASFTVVPRGG
ncbi:hypothetical protein [Mycolicibacterium hippocampi]|uniref:hypothetical protein n=1 Tax=Mycolicibacterium hippocampi TaxID=659824 RepID=UPI0021F37D20|nr:hypothetical protein [Mycolicibacterium hippocampi]